MSEIYTTCEPSDAFWEGIRYTVSISEAIPKMEKYTKNRKGFAWYPGFYIDFINQDGEITRKLYKNSSIADGIIITSKELYNFHKTCDFRNYEIDLYNWFIKTRIYSHESELGN